MVSKIITRLWLWPVVCSFSKASVAVCTAVSKPKLCSQPTMSLSMVLGTPTTCKPRCARPLAMCMLPSPPITTKASSPRARACCNTRSVSAAWAKGLAVLLVPKMVPPCMRMPLTSSQPNGRVCGVALIKPAKPPSMPVTRAWHWLSSDLVTARITALSPGQSPPPVRMPTCNAELMLRPCSGFGPQRPQAQGLLDAGGQGVGLVTPAGKKVGPHRAHNGRAGVLRHHQAPHLCMRPG